MVVVLTVTFKVAPVPIAVPPQLPLYHLHVAPEPKLPPVIPSVTDPGPHSAVEVAVAVWRSFPMFLDITARLL